MTNGNWRIIPNTKKLAERGYEMAPVFGREGRNLYNAFFIPDTAKRRAALDEWIKSTTPIIQAAVSEELKSLVELVTENRWDEDGWRRGEEKLRRIQNDYHLIMDIKLRQISSREKIMGSLPDPIIRKTEIDLHGMTVKEALPLVDNFLKDSYNAHERRVWIIHGKGAGVLREEVRKYLENHQLVESFVQADQSHGEEGATQVDIKEWVFS